MEAVPMGDDVVGREAWGEEEVELAAWVTDQKQKELIARHQQDSREVLLQPIGTSSAHKTHTKRSKAAQHSDTRVTLKHPRT